MSTVFAAFSSEQAARLAGLSKRRVEYWDSEGVFHPSLRHADGVPFNRIYSFQDLVALRTLAMLRERVSLQRLRKVGDWLKSNYDQPWSALRFYLDGDRIVFVDPSTGHYVSTEPRGQAEFRYELEDVAHDVTVRFHEMQKRRTEDVGQITRNRNIMRNAPVIAGTRIPSEIIWQFHEAEYTPEEILREYPQLSIDDVNAAITFEQSRQSQGKRRRRPAA